MTDPQLEKEPDDTSEQADSDTGRAYGGAMGGSADNDGGTPGDYTTGTGDYTGDQGTNREGMGQRDMGGEGQEKEDEEKPGY